MKNNKKLWKLLESTVLNAEPTPDDVIEFMYDNDDIPVSDLAEIVSGNFSLNALENTYRSLPESIGERDSKKGGEIIEVSIEVRNIKNVLKDALLVKYTYYDQIEEVFGTKDGLRLENIPDYIVLSKIVRDLPIY